MSRLLPAWLRCGNRAAPAIDGVWATREGKSKDIPAHNAQTLLFNEEISFIRTCCSRISSVDPAQL